MTFYVQYDSVTGAINATVSTDKTIDTLPEGVSQLALDAAVETIGKKIDITQNPPVLVDDDLHQ